MDMIDHCSAVPKSPSRLQALDLGSSNAPTAVVVPNLPPAGKPFDILFHGVIITDAEGKATYMNKRAKDILWRTSDHVLGHSIVKILLGSAEELHNDHSACSDIMQDGQYNVQLARHVEGCQAIEVSVVTLYEDSRNFSGKLYDIRVPIEQAPNHDQHSYESIHGILTDLTNICALQKYLKHKHYWSPVPGAQSILAFLDIDGFKNINDECGQNAGDVILRDIANCLKTNTRQSDYVARIGGDKFVVLLTACDMSEANKILDEIRTELSFYRCNLIDYEYCVTLSIGVIDFNYMIDPIAALRHAELACYRAKAAGGNRTFIERRYKTFDKITNLRRSVPQRLIDDKHYRLYQQPIYSLRSADSKQRFDVLLRILDQGKIIISDEFMPDARRFGVEAELDQWVLSALAKVWEEHFSMSEQNCLECFINLSRSSVMETSRTIEYMRDLISEYVLPTGLICLNIQLRDIIEHEKNAIELTHGLSALGVKIVIDGIDGRRDHNSADCLKGLHMDYIKIPAQVMTLAMENPRYAAYLESLSIISRTQGVPLIGVHIESHEHLRSVRKLELDYAQGHALSAPEPFTSGWVGNHILATQCSLHCAT